MNTLDADRRLSARRRVAAAARTMTTLGGFESVPWDEVGASAGASPRSMRMLFRDEGDLLDELNEQLVLESADRLALVAATLSSVAHDPHEAMRAVVQSVIRARPLDRSGLLVRLERRARSLRLARPDEATRVAERRFLRVLTGEIVHLLAAAGREPSVPAPDLGRVLLNSYERAFEAWLVAGHPEHTFGESRFAADTLPTLLLALSRPQPAALVPDLEEQS